MPRRRIGLGAWLLAAIAVTAGAATPTWVSLGPEGGTVLWIDLDPAASGTAYVATPAGIWKTIDGGASWVYRSSGLETAGINDYEYAVAVDPTDSSVVYASDLFFGGIFKSTDAGTTWVRRATGIGDPTTRPIVVAPTDPLRLYTASNSSVYTSADGGASWAPANNGMGGFAYVLVVDPTDPLRVLAGSSGGVFRTTDGGATWTAGNLGASAPNLVLDPTDPQVVYAGTCFSGLFKSIDGGATFNQLSGLPVGCGCAVAVDPVDPATLYASPANQGIWKSVDGGGSWTLVYASSAMVHRLIIDPASPATLWAATDGDGILRSTDAGASWSTRNTGLVAQYSSGPVMNPSNPALLYSGTSSGIARSSDGGGSWTIVPPPQVPFNPAPGAGAIAIDPTAPNIVYAGYQGGVAKSTDGGLTFAPASDGFSLSSVRAIAVDPNSPATVFAACYGPGLFRSRDRGQTWTFVGAGLGTLMFDVLVDPSTNPSTVYAAAQSSGVYKSVDGGTIWKSKSSGLLSLNTYSLARDPSAPSTLYLAVPSAGIFKSTDGANTWVQRNNGLTNAYTQVVRVDPAHPNIVYAGTYNTPYVGVYQSTDGASTWHAIPYSGLRSNEVTGLAVDPSGTTLYAATSGGGLYKRTVLCGTDADCDDANACTTDSCAPGNAQGGADGCRHVATICLAPASPCELNTCNPASGLCEPSNRPDGTLCDDGTFCTSADACQAGACIGQATPRPLCATPLVPGAAKLAYKRAVGRGVDTLVWGWQKGPTTLAQIGNPLGTTGYVLCVYDQGGAGATTSVAFEAAAPAAGLCAGKPCWSVAGFGFKYKNPDATPSGVRKAGLKSLGDGSAKLALGGRGALLALPARPLVPPVVAQLRRTDTTSVCWTASFDAGIRKNDAVSFTARSGSPGGAFLDEPH